jgi:hypothetical protein
MGHDFIHGCVAGGVEDEVIMFSLVIVVEVGFIACPCPVFILRIDDLMARNGVGDGGNLAQNALLAEFTDEGFQGVVGIQGVLFCGNVETKAVVWCIKRQGVGVAVWRVGVQVKAFWESKGDGTDVKAAALVKKHKFFLLTLLYRKFTTIIVSNIVEI